MRDPVTLCVNVSASANGRIRNIGRSRHQWKPHQKWPNQSSDGLAFKELEGHLRENPSKHCCVHRLFYSDDLAKGGLRFDHERRAVSSVDLQRLLQE